MPGDPLGWRPRSARGGGAGTDSALARNRRYTEIVGIDVSSRTLAIAQRRLRLDRLPERQILACESEPVDPRL